ncbi:thioredoxin family protein [Bacillus sp. T33-2]|uniref:thioredoxin family protein n=1 Tax=Bacillus sp. T33-2 TaxID=2054168 RepID=UPI000C766432|nr:thioredoxin family protein [Bacillus sp. T33-2]PLR98180.1 thiol reductase thioredoxin [Bacillus sp. T33-2]
MLVTINSWESRSGGYSHMKNLEAMSQFEDLKNSGKHIFLFSADWCPDCRVIEPVLPEIENKFKEFTFVYVDRDQFIDLCAQLDVFGIPSFIAYENGKELGRFVSKDRKTQEEIENFITGLS